MPLLGTRGAASARGFGFAGIGRPGAPTIGTATATGTSTATVSFTAPAFNGGSPITGYTAVSSPGGITGTVFGAGSNTITVSGLNAGTTYTFTVFATNALGNGPSSASSNSITTQVPSGSSTYTSAGVFSWTAPAGVTSVSVVCIGGGAHARGPGYGRGGDLSYANNIAVTPGATYSVQVGQPSYGFSSTSDYENSYFSWCYARGGGQSVGNIRDGGGDGGGATGSWGGGSGAGGYTGNGGLGGRYYGENGTAGSGGAGGGGGGQSGTSEPEGGGGGGGVNVYGLGTSGAGGAFGTGGWGSPPGGTGGGGGSSGGSGQTGYSTPEESGYTRTEGGMGGSYGGGGGATNEDGGNAYSGAVRIIWPGTTRQFPSTNT